MFIHTIKRKADKNKLCYPFDTLAQLITANVPKNRRQFFNPPRLRFANTPATARANVAQIKVGGSSAIGKTLPAMLERRPCKTTTRFDGLTFYY